MIMGVADGKADGRLSPAPGTTGEAAAAGAVTTLCSIRDVLGRFTVAGLGDGAT
jgi:hypothetical protein